MCMSQKNLKPLNKRGTNYIKIELIVFVTFEYGICIFHTFRTQILSLVPYF